MGFKRKHIAAACLGFALLVLLVLWGTGEFFVNYAVVRGPKGNERNVESVYETDTMTETVKAKNRERQKLDTKEWLQTCEKSPVVISSIDGLSLVANVYETTETMESHRWVLLLHGYGGAKENLEDIGQRYSEKGYRVVAPDMRAHGESGGEYVGMGWLDKSDVLQWLQWILTEDSEAEIVLHGVSMGAATVMMTAGEEELPAQVIAAVEDCGYTSVWDIFASELDARFNLPPFPVLYSARLVGRLRAGYDIREASALEQLKKSKLPMLFIHGAEDDFVPTDMIYSLYDTAVCEKEMIIIEGAGHSEARTADPEKYYKTVFEFLEKYSNIPSTVK